MSNDGMSNLRIKMEQIQEFAKRYPSQEDAPIEEIGQSFRMRGYLQKGEFVDLCKWKSPRSQKLCRTNSESLIREATKCALVTNNEELRMGVLRILCGVDWPTASVILHFGFIDLFPILDFRAIWTLGFQQPANYDFAFWWRYVECCREIAQKVQLPMRQIDRALWQFSKENQGSGKTS